MSCGQWTTRPRFGRLIPGAQAVIFGGGSIGLEIAAAARQAELDATVLERAPRVLARVTSPVVSDFFHRAHCEQGVNIVVDEFPRTSTDDIFAVGDVARHPDAQQGG
jgi:pyruvate/2-oxoglutarate dehydrogenase complex dihydrolipoamide dehydrogenase (E3) component